MVARPKEGRKKERGERASHGQEDEEKIKISKSSMVVVKMHCPTSTQRDYHFPLATFCLHLIR
jgi:hypothetical protein